MDGGTTDHDAANRARFGSDRAVASYDPRNGLTPTEAALVDRWVPPGARVLDLGIGTGRTVGPLAERAGRYVGIDYAEAMVAAARAVHPDRDLRVGDAARLTEFADRSFDVVVFSFNGLDYLHPDAKRRACLDEVARVLAPGGTFVFSTHDPRALLRPPVAGGGVRGLAVAGYQTARRLADRLPTAAFRSGEGWVHDRVLGGLETHMAVPRAVIVETCDHGFTWRETAPGEGTRGGRWSTSWWYYAFERAG